MSCEYDCNGGFKNCCKGREGCCDACPMEFTLCRGSDGCRDDRFITMYEKPRGLSSGFVIYNPLEFIAPPAIRRNERPLQSAHGVSDSLHFYGPRTLTATGVMFACSRGELKCMQDQLVKLMALNANQDVFGENGYFMLKYNDECGTCKSMCVKMLGPPTFEPYEGKLCNARRFTFTLITQDERILGCEQRSECGDETPLTGGFKMCGTKLCDAKLCQEPLPSTEACNEGCYDARPNITITGPAVNPKIWNTSNDTCIQVGITLTEFDTLEIDVETRSIIKTDVAGNETDVTGLISLDSDWIFLGPCCNNLALTTDRPDILGASYCVEFLDTFI